MFSPCARQRMAWRLFQASFRGRTFSTQASVADAVRGLLGDAKGGKFPLPNAQKLVDLYESTAQAKSDRQSYLLTLATTAPSAEVNLPSKPLVAGSPEAVKLRTELTSVNEAFFQQALSLPNGLYYLLRLRDDLVAAAAAAQKASATADLAAIQSLTTSLTGFLTSWVHQGWLRFRPITFADKESVLQTIINNDKVHPIADKTALQRRLPPSPSRRCFGLFHPLMDTPLVFVEVALTPEVASSMKPIHGGESTSDERAAMFYSINNIHTALPGVDLGNALIKQAAGFLKTQGVQQFSSLSPIPGFRKWFTTTVGKPDQSPPSLKAVLANPQFVSDVTAACAAAGLKADSYPNPLAALNAVLSLPDWFEKGDILSHVRRPVTTLTMVYLYMERNKSKKPIDPVAGFHLKNGAQLWRVNWLGDTSKKRVSESFGMMVNYYYDLPTTQQNSKKFNEGTITLGQPFMNQAKEMGLEVMP